VIGELKRVMMNIHAIECNTEIVTTCARIEYRISLLLTSSSIVSELKVGSRLH
jgi:hypothetical protein